MPYELIYTSAEQGLRSGTRGFCTVATTRGLTQNFVVLLEQLSAYRHLIKPTSPKNPVVRSHVIVQQNGLLYHILSRISDPGLDYTNRSNKIAHHLIFDSKETDLFPGGPAEILANDEIFCKAWKEKPHELPIRKDLPIDNPPPAVCSHWRDATGDAGFGGYLAESAMKNTPSYFTFSSPEEPIQSFTTDDLLALYQESIRLLSPRDRWGVTFTTCYTNFPLSVQCLWRAVPAGAPEEGSLRAISSANFFDFARKSSFQLPQNAEYMDLVNFARSGIKKIVPPPPSVRVEMKEKHDLFYSDKINQSDEDFEAYIRRMPPDSQKKGNHKNQNSSVKFCEDIEESPSDLRFGRKKREFSNQKRYWILAGIISLIVLLSLVIIFLLVDRSHLAKKNETDEKNVAVKNTKENTSKSIPETEENPVEKSSPEKSLPEKSSPGKSSQESPKKEPSPSPTTPSVSSKTDEIPNDKNNSETDTKNNGSSNIPKKDKPKENPKDDKLPASSKKETGDDEGKKASNSNDSDDKKGTDSEDKSQKDIIIPESKDNDRKENTNSSKKDNDKPFKLKTSFFSLAPYEKTNKKNRDNIQDNIKFFEEPKLTNKLKNMKKEGQSLELVLEPICFVNENSKKHEYKIEKVKDKEKKDNDIWKIYVKAPDGRKSDLFTIDIKNNKFYIINQNKTETTFSNEKDSKDQEKIELDFHQKLALLSCITFQIKDGEEVIETFEQQLLNYEIDTNKNKKSIAVFLQELFKVLANKSKILASSFNTKNTKEEVLELVLKKEGISKIYDMKKIGSRERDDFIKHMDLDVKEGFIDDMNIEIRSGDKHYIILKK